MGRFEENLFDAMGVSPDDVTPEQRQMAQETRDSYRHKGNAMMALGCGGTIAVLLIIILIALL